MNGHSRKRLISAASAVWTNSAKSSGLEKRGHREPKLAYFADGGLCQNCPANVSRTASGSTG